MNINAKPSMQLINKLIKLEVVKLSAGEKYAVTHLGIQIAVSTCYDDAHNIKSYLPKYLSEYNEYLLNNTSMAQCSPEMFLSLCKQSQFKNQWATHLKL